MTDNNLHISDNAFELIHNFLSSTLGHVPSDEECLAAVEEVMMNAAAFCQIFGRSPFIFEPVHCFDGLITREGTLNHHLELRLVLSGPRLFIRSPEECPVDEGYEVRKVIAESSFPEFQPNADKT